MAAIFLVLGNTSICFASEMSVNSRSNEAVQNNYGGFSSEKEVVDYLKENQVPDDKIDILVYKLKNNILWDCYLEENNSLVPDEFYEFDINTSIKERYFRFADGSFISVSVGGGEIIENQGRTIVSDSFGALY